MKLRTQLTLAQLPLVLIVIVLAVSLLFYLKLIQHKSEVVLEDNLKCIESMQRVNILIEELNDTILISSDQIEKNKDKIEDIEHRIEDQLIAQARNRQVPEEKELTKKLIKEWDTYLKAERSKSFPAMRKIYKEIKVLTNKIMEKNEREILETKEKLVSYISSIYFYITLGSVLSLTLGFYLSWFFMRLFLRPLNKLTDIIHRMGTEEKMTLLHIKGSEEIENLCEAFNGMTRRLETYHKGSIGKLVQTTHSLKAGFDSLPCPILIVDMNANIIYKNKLAQNLSVKIRNVLTLFRITVEWKDTLLKIFNHVMESKVSYTPEKNQDIISIVKSNKKHFWMPWGYPILDQDVLPQKRVQGVVLVLEDVVKGHMIEMDQKEAYETLAHEIQPPLLDLHMAIHTCLQQDGGPLTSKQEELLQAAREKCNLLKKLSMDLLKVSKVPPKDQNPQLEEIDLNEVVIKAIAFLSLEAKSKEVEIEYKEPPYLSKIHGSIEQMDALFNNLLRYAIQDALPKTQVVVSLKEKGKDVLLEVNHKGTYLPQKDRKDVFEKSYKTPGKAKGKEGLGLYVVHQICHSFGGKYDLKSTKKEGTTVSVSFPSV